MSVARAPHHSLPGLGLIALGVVFGDIGTSPLYALQTVFSINHNSVEASPQHVYGIISMVFWSLTAIVLIKYAVLVMRGDNDGEGGLLALVALLRRKLRKWHRLGLVLSFGMVGAALFLGDSLITPAISVMSAVEGLELVSPGAQAYVVPASVVILSVLFAVQRFGTAVIGRAFGPIMLIWFLLLAVIAVPHIAGHPEILFALSPHHAFAFVIAEPLIGFIAMGAVVLTITGAEALYADMGHLGPNPIRLAFVCVVMPSLVINYLGQGAMIIEDPATVSNPFFSLAPTWARLPLVLVATIATVIASQAVIAGAFSVTRQAYRLGLLPRMAVRHTSAQESGQVYLPVVNWLLYVGVIMLVLLFHSSERLAAAYGLAVTGTLLATSALFCLLAREVWQWPWLKLGLVMGPIMTLEMLYFLANVVKIPSGGWLPLVIAVVLALVMSTWRRGSEVVQKRRSEIEGPMRKFVQQLREEPVQRVPGTAIYPHADPATTPFALKSNCAFNHVIHERIIVVKMATLDIPHVPAPERVQVLDHGFSDMGIVHLCITVGYTDPQNLPEGLRQAAQEYPDLVSDLEHAKYILSTMKLEDDRRSGMSHFRTKLFIWLARNSADRAVVLHLPLARTAIVGGNLAI